MEVILNKICVVAGVGPGNGRSLSNRFSSEGYTVIMLSRSPEYLEQLAREIPNSLGMVCDLSKPESISSVFERIRNEVGIVDTLIYNAGSGQWTSVMETSTSGMYSCWSTNTLGLLSCGHQVIPDMSARNHGNIIIMGATASLRGGVHSVAFASAKAAQRSLAQSMARDLGPKGIHISYIIIDGIIDIERARIAMPDKPDTFFLNPDEIAANVYMLTQQDHSTWTFELDLRPFGESW